MHVRALHRWDLPPAEAIAVQQSLRGHVVTRNELGRVRAVAGVDISTARGRAHAAIVVLRFPELEPLESVEADLPLTFPYIPGLLAFREAPAILAAVQELRSEPDLFVFDGQGLAHPRRMGIASHVGLILDKPSIGCAKSLLCGHCEPVGAAVGDHAELLDRGEVIGAAVRTREGTKPVYVSIGHKVDLATAVSYVLRCCRGYRLPETTRWAHRVAGGAKLPSFPVGQEKRSQKTRGARDDGAAGD
jgi:deoxyribonuclease V